MATEFHALRPSTPRAELQHSAELKRIRLDLPKLEEDGCGGWLSACMGLRPRTEEELKALQATKQPEACT